VHRSVERESTPVDALVPTATHRGFCGSRDYEDQDDLSLRPRPDNLVEQGDEVGAGSTIGK
jgi:hypothetical protein